MRLAMTIGALAVLLLLPAGDLAAQRAQEDRPTAGQQRTSQPASVVQRRASQPRQAAAVPRAAQAPRAATRQVAAAQARPANTRQVTQARAASARQQPAAPLTAAQRSGLFRSAAAAPAGMPRTTGACARRDAQGRCVRTPAANTRWQGGLPPMTMAQQECPSGTVATLARGHANVVRCLPI
jgi:hypothetical protein